MFKSLLGSLFLSSDAKTLGENFTKSKIKGAEVVGRGTIVVDGKEIASSTEFLALKKQARKIIDSRQRSEA